MRPERWWSVILTMGLFMALSPLSAQAGPNRTFAPQPNRQAFTQPQPRAFAPQVNRQAFTPSQPRAFANGWNSQPHQWQQPRGNAYWLEWPKPSVAAAPGNAYGWNGQNRIRGNSTPAMPMAGMPKPSVAAHPRQCLRLEWSPAPVGPAPECLRPE